MGDPGGDKARPPIIIACMLIFYAMYLERLNFRSPLNLAYAAALVAASVGLLRRQEWAKWITLACTVVAWVVWFWSVAMVIRTGWPYPDFLRSAFSLIPGILWLATWGLIALLVWNRPRSPASEA